MVRREFFPRRQWHAATFSLRETVFVRCWNKQFSSRGGRHLESIAVVFSQFHISPKYRVVTDAILSYRVGMFRATPSAGMLAAHL